MARPPTKVKLLHSNESQSVIRSLMLRDMGMFFYNYQVSNAHVLESVAESSLIHKDPLIDKSYKFTDQVPSTFLMVFSHSRMNMASAHGNHVVYVSDIGKRKTLHMLTGHPRSPWCIAYHPCFEHIIASGCLSGLVRIWDLKTGLSIKTAQFSSVIASVAFHPFQQLLIIAAGNQILFWDWEEDEPTFTVNTGAPHQKVRFVAFDRLGKKLITGIGNPRAGEPYCEPLITRTLFSRIRFTTVSEEPGTSGTVQEISDPSEASPLSRIFATIDMRPRSEINWLTFEEEDDDDLGEITYRIQAWDFTEGQLPDIRNPRKNLVIPKCRIHNDGSLDISRDGMILATTFENGAGMYSLQWNTLGAEICRTEINDHVLSVSISPSQQHLLVGVANTRYAQNYLMANVYKLMNSKPVTEEGSDVILYYKKSMTLVRQLRDGSNMSSPTSLNCIKWTPTPGMGVVYATNQGRLALIQ